MSKTLQGHRKVHGVQCVVIIRYYKIQNGIVMLSSTSKILG